MWYLEEDIDLKRETPEKNQHPPAPFPEVPSSPTVDNIYNANSYPWNLTSKPRKSPPMSPWTHPLQPKVPISDTETPPGNHNRKYQSRRPHPSRRIVWSLKAATNLKRGNPEKFCKKISLSLLPQTTPGLIITGSGWENLYSNFSSTLLLLYKTYPSITKSPNEIVASLSLHMKKGNP